MAPTLKLITERVPGGKMELMLKEKVKEIAEGKPLTSQFYLTSMGPTHSYARKNIIRSYNTDTASVLTKN